MNVKILLDENLFKALVKGEVITVRRPDSEIKFALQDIGWDRMLLAIQEAMEKKKGGVE